MNSLEQSDFKDLLPLSAGMTSLRAINVINQNLFFRRDSVVDGCLHISVELTTPTEESIFNSM